MSDCARMVSGWLICSIVVVACAAAPQAQAPASLAGYRLPTTETRLTTNSQARVEAAKTVAVLATSMPFMRKDGAGLLVTYRSGRVGAERAKADVLKALSEWGAFTVIDDPGAADLVFAIQEETLGPGFMSDGKPRLKDTLAVYPTGGPGVASPLWVGIDTENALSAATGLTAPDAEGVVQRFRRDVENASKRRPR